MTITRLIAAAALTLAVLPASAEVVTKTSPHSVADTADRLVAAVENAGAMVFARVDHAAGALSVGDDLRPTTLVMFGNPKLGTPALLSDQLAGLDLPIRVVIFEAEDGTVTLAWHNPAELAEDYEIAPELPALGMMTGAIDNLTNAATAE